MVVDYHLIENSVAGYLDSISELTRLGESTVGKENGTLIAAQVRLALRISRNYVVHGYPEEDFDLILEKTLLPDSGIALKAAHIGFPVHQSIIGQGLQPYIRRQADIGLFSAFLEGRGKDPDPYIKRMEAKYDLAARIADYIFTRIIFSSQMTPRGEG